MSDFSHGASGPATNCFSGSDNLASSTNSSLVDAAMHSAHFDLEKSHKAALHLSSFSTFSVVSNLQRIALGLVAKEQIPIRGTAPETKLVLFRAPKREFVTGDQITNKAIDSKYNYVSFAFSVREEC